MKARMGVLGSNNLVSKKYSELQNDQQLRLDNTTRLARLLRQILGDRGPGQAQRAAQCAVLLEEHRRL